MKKGAREKFWVLKFQCFLQKAVQRFNVPKGALQKAVFVPHKKSNLIKVIVEIRTLKQLHVPICDYFSRPPRRGFLPNKIKTVVQVRMLRQLRITRYDYFTTG